MSIIALLVAFVITPCSMSYKIFVSCSPKNTEIIAGGASFAPNRWSLLLEAIDALSKSAWWYTARMVAVKKTKNWTLSCGDWPGLSRLLPKLSDNDQLQCFPEPLIPAKGFSWRSAASLCFWATRFNVSIIKWLWSTAILASSNIGAISYWAGATSLWRVFAGIPNLYNSSSTSCIYESIRSLMLPKQWSSSCCPFDGGAPIRVRPVNARSGRL